MCITFSSRVLHVCLLTGMGVILWMLSVHYLLIQGVACVFADRYVWDPVDAECALPSHPGCCMCVC